MTAPDLLAALGPLLDTLLALGVRHFVGGSIASSAHGVARATIDADVVAELAPGARGSSRLRPRRPLLRLRAPRSGRDRAPGVEHGARELGVSDLLARAVAEGGRQ